MFMSNSHTPSNILFSKALTDTTYVDLMKIAYSGWCLYRAQSPSTSDTTGALVSRGWYSGRLYVAANLNLTTSGITTTYGMTSTGTIYTPTLIVNGTTASTDYLTGALTVWCRYSGKLRVNGVVAFMI
jgi:hypothetical protein